MIDRITKLMMQEDAKEYADTYCDLETEKDYMVAYLVNDFEKYFEMGYEADRKEATNN